MKRIWLVAAENGALPGGKVGGVGDVVRDLPLALAASSEEVRVITPSYGMLHKLPGASLYRTVQTRFAEETHTAAVYRVLLSPTVRLSILSSNTLFSPRTARAGFTLVMKRGNHLQSMPPNLLFSMRS
jgi:glycogen synthase